MLRTLHSAGFAPNFGGNALNVIARAVGLPPLDLLSVADKLKFSDTEQPDKVLLRTELEDAEHDKYVVSASGKSFIWSRSVLSELFDSTLIDRVTFYKKQHNLKEPV